MNGHTETAPRADRSTVAQDHTRPVLRTPAALAATALRTRSVHSREIFAALAWPGHDTDELAAWADGGAEWPSLLQDQDAEWLARYAAVLAVQTGAPEEAAQARRILEAVHAAGLLTGRRVEMLAQLRLADRDAEGVDALLDSSELRSSVRDALRADRANPMLFADGDHEEWRRLFNTTLHSRALTDVDLQEGARLSPLDRLGCPPLPAVDSDVRISVMMSCFRPGPALVTAVRAVLEQTWTNTELLVIDDASGEDSRELLREVEALDPRVRVIRKAVNGGTYRARNTALRLATGDFCMILDSDDYLHPQALESGVAPLLLDPSLMATRQQGVRISEDLELNRPGYAPRMMAAGTLLFRRAQVMNRVGWFDITSKGADTEFARRIEAAFGPVIRDIREVVLFLRGGDTLSAGEFGAGWRHPARHAYKTMFGRWHRHIAAGSASPFLDPHEPRPFPEPRRWVKPVVPGLAGRGSIDICFAGDWRRYGGPQRSMLEEIRACRAAGLRVAVMHLESFRFMTTKDHPLCSPIQELMAAGEVEWLQADDDVDVSVLMIRYPPILQYPPQLSRPAVRASLTLVMANQAPLEPDGRDQRYTVPDVSQRSEELFGSAPLWVPQSPGIREVLLAQDPDVALTTWDNPGLIDPEQWRARIPGPPGRSGSVVVGRYSRDDAIKFPPTFAALLRGYGLPAPEYRVRMMGAVNTVAKLSRAQVQQEAGLTDPDQVRLAARELIPDNWELFRHGSIDVHEFLAGLDFFLYLDNPNAFEAFGRVILEAAASGVLTIVHPKHREAFGDVVDYATEDNAADVIAAYVNDPDAYVRRVARSQELVAHRYGHAAFADRVMQLIERPGITPADDATTTEQSTDDAVELRLRRTLDAVGGLVVDVEATNLEVLSLPLRSLADAERADQVSVIHHTGGASRVREWLRDELVGPVSEGCGWIGTARAPTGVLALVMTRSGRVSVTSPEAVVTCIDPGGTLPARWVSADGGRRIRGTLASDRPLRLRLTPVPGH